jgi:membrane associated rhomboid family serine protease
MWNTLPPATRAIIAANVVAYLLQQVIGETMVRLFALWPVGTALFEPWQLVTYAFLHASIPHIFFNMFALFMFGRALEYFWGSRRFIVFYFACVTSAAATQLLMPYLSAGAAGPTIGASGGVFGLLLAFAIYFPRQKITLLFPPIPMPAWLFVTLYGALELVLGVTNTEAGVAHFAHLGGMLGGAILILYWRARRASRS